MVNRVRKGNVAERRARKELESQGWTIIFKSIRTRFGAQDLAKLFDICAVQGSEWVFISVKHWNNGNTYLAHRKEIAVFKTLHGLPGMLFYVWIWRKRVGWNKVQI